MSAPRVLFWVQHLVGVGHQRRSAAIARALAQAGATVCYVSGGRRVDGLDLHGCEFVQLPAVRSLDMRYHTLVDIDDAPIDDDFRARRRQRLLSVFAAFAPDVVITETWPFGRGLLRFELEPLMAAAHAARPRPLLVSSIRDIVEHRQQAAKFDKMAQRVEQYFDRVLVHGDPALVSFADSFPPAARLGDRVQYTGYVSEHAPVTARKRHYSGPVIVSAGGGFFGERMLQTAIDAFSLCASGKPVATTAMQTAATRPWHILAGPNLPAQRFDALRSSAPPGVFVQRNREDFHQLLASCSVSVSQGGYNTVVDLLALRVPAVVVPYEDEREREQVVRALALSRRELVHMLSYKDLSPRTLAQAVVSVLHGDGMPAMQINLNGAAQSAGLLLQAMDKHRGEV